MARRRIKYDLCFFTCTLLLLFDRVPGADGGHHELRREMATLKDVVLAIERKLTAAELSKKIENIDATLNSLASKVVEIHRKSLLLSEIHQDDDARRELLLRISRGVEEIGRKQSSKKNEADTERLGKLSENVQALFQIFGGMNRKLDDLQTRVERMANLCPLSDLKFFITKKIDSLTASTVLLSECLECDRESLADMMRSFLRIPLNAVAEKCAAEKIAEAEWTKLQSRLETAIRRECRGPAAHELAYSHQESRDEAAVQRESPGRIFRKLWRKMTEPINKVGEKMDALTQAVELSNAKHHNETVARLKDWIGKANVAEPCHRPMQEILNNTLDTAQRLGYIESRQLSVQNLCSKILVEVERMKSDLEVASSRYIPGATDAYHEGAGQGYLVATSCADLQAQGTVKSGIYTIKPKAVPEAFLAFCDLETEGGGWTVLQRRGDFGEEFRQNFTQNWEMYKRGFGDLQREFWIGNEKMHYLSSQEDVKLRVDLEDFDEKCAYAEYSRFKVEEESEQFRLSVGDYRGNATDSLSLHDGKLFSTQDRDNDEVASCCNCADTFKGGWWYYRCFEANLNGPYHTLPTENGYFMGIIWERWRGDYSLKSSEMKIRPLSFEDPQDP